MVGRLLDGRYRIEDRIARGGMATVYTATDTRLDRVVALKIMHDGLGSDEDFADRFVHEARAAARSTTRTWSPSSTRARTTARSTW
jgi:serine/threonine-protein kinase